MAENLVPRHHLKFVRVKLSVGPVSWWRSMHFGAGGGPTIPVRPSVVEGPTARRRREGVSIQLVVPWRKRVAIWLFIKRHGRAVPVWLFIERWWGHDRFAARDLAGGGTYGFSSKGGCPYGLLSNGQYATRIVLFGALDRVMEVVRWWSVHWVAGRFSVRAMWRWTIWRERKDLGWRKIVLSNRVAAFGAKKNPLF